MPTFVHTADVHLDTVFSARFTPSQAEIRRKEVMMTFGNIVKKAAETDFLLISGDLFDDKYVSSETTAFLKRCFASIPKTQVFISAGNHDPLTGESVYTNTDFGDNVHVFSDNAEYYDFPELKTRVHGISFGSEHCESSILDEFEAAEGWCNILVVHGDVVAPGGGSNYNPITNEIIENTGMTYVALGHIHKYSGIKNAGGVYYAYPGIPEGRGFDEDGDRGYIIGRCDNSVASIEYTSSCRRKFEHLSIDVSGCTDSLEILEKIREAVTENGAENMYKAELVGKIDQSYINRDLLSGQMDGEAFYIEIINHTAPEYDIEEIVKEPGLRGDFAAEMLKLTKEMPIEKQEIGRLALYMGLDAMEEEREP